MLIPFSAPYSIADDHIWFPKSPTREQASFLQRIGVKDVEVWRTRTGSNFIRIDLPSDQFECVMIYSDISQYPNLEDFYAEAKAITFSTYRVDEDIRTANGSSIPDLPVKNFMVDLPVEKFHAVMIIPNLAMNAKMQVRCNKFKIICLKLETQDFFNPHAFFLEVNTEHGEQAPFLDWDTRFILCYELLRIWRER